MKETDTRRRFVFDNANIRGTFVHLDATWKALLERKLYPEPVRDQLGKLLAAGALLSSTIKYDGSLIMQIQAEGPITLVVVEAASSGTLRGMAKWKGDVSDGSIEQLFGKGRLMFTVESNQDQNTYQGIVSLEGETLAQTMEAYFFRSEQIETQMWLSVNASSATGLLIQKLPGGVDEDQDAWLRAQHLASTISHEELQDLSAEENIKRIFAQEDIRLFDGEPMSFRCTCSRERVSNMLRTLGIDEVHSIIEEQGEVEVSCEFCNQAYVFDRVDAEELFAAAIQTDVSKTRH